MPAQNNVTGYRWFSGWKRRVLRHLRVREDDIERSISPVYVRIKKGQRVSRFVKNIEQRVMETWPLDNVMDLEPDMQGTNDIFVVKIRNRKLTDTELKHIGECAERGQLIILFGTIEQRITVGICDWNYIYAYK